MRVVLDAMGGDTFPAPQIEGAVQAAQSGVNVILVGREPDLTQELSKHNTPTIEIVHAPEVVDMHEHPAQAVRQKKDSSINVAMRLLKEKKADALFSAGNSGAVMASALLTLGRIPGVHRPAIGGVLPLLSSRVFLVDIGANADCDPNNLLQFAQLGSAYMRHVFGVSSPRVGLVSNGEEETKGSALVQAAHPLLKDSGLNFIGNVEGKDVTRGACDVAVTDGFTGNVMLKLAEGMQELILGLVREAILSKPHYKLAGAILKPGLRAAGRRLDYTEYGGAPLVGINGPVFIGHGRSNAKAIQNGLRTASAASTSTLIPALAAAVEP